MAVTFLHLADTHLGSPLEALGGADEAMATRLARAAEAALERAVDVALEREVDFLVLAGDCYDREARSVRANRVLADELGRLGEAGIPAYVIHGNHDPLGQGAELLELPDTVHVFGSESVEAVPVPDAEDPIAEVIGRSYGSRHEGRSLVDDYAPETAGVPTVGLLHTALDPDGRRYVPCSEADLSSHAVDYWALGHVHHPRDLGAAPGAYPGIPQPRHVREPSVGGCLLVECAHTRAPSLEYVPTGPVVWREVSLDVCELGTTLSDLESAMVDRAIELRQEPLADLLEHDIPVLDTGWRPDGLVVRWRLTGRGQVHGALADEEATAYLTETLREALAADDPFVWTETVRDRTAPPLPDRETLAEENDLLDALLELAPEVREDPEAREELRSRAGGAWETVEDPDREDTKVDRIPLTDDRLDALLEEATEVALTTIVEGADAD